MARPNYGPGELCAFDDFPQSIRLVVGEKLASESSLFEYGLTVRLYQTPTSGVTQGDKVVGEELPKKEMIYTDTGEDDSFNLKVGYYGWGEFLIVTEGDDYFSLTITKGMTLQAGDWDEEENFFKTVSGQTKIPNTENMQQEYSVGLQREVSVITIPDTDLTYPYDCNRFKAAGLFEDDIAPNDPDSYYAYEEALKWLCKEINSGPPSDWRSGKFPDYEWHLSTIRADVKQRYESIKAQIDLSEDDSEDTSGGGSAGSTDSSDVGYISPSTEVVDSGDHTTIIQTHSDGSMEYTVLEN